MAVFALGVGHEEGLGTGWTVYAPLNSRGSHSGSSVDTGIFALHLMGLASILGSVNFEATALAMRAQSIESGQLDLYVWSVVITSWLLIMVVPVLAGAITMVLLDRSLGTSFYAVAGGGDPLLYEHLFWFFGHPEVYIIILPFFGVLSVCAGAVSGVGVFGRTGMIYAMLGIAVVGSYVWGHHMYVAGIDIESRAYYAAATMVIGVPTAIKVNNWLMTLFKGQGLMTLEGMTVLCFMSMFTLGGLTGLVLSNAAIDVSLHDTQYVVGHFHYVLSLGALFGVILAQAFWRPKVTGRIGNEAMARSMLALIYMGTTMTFWPMHGAGLSGVPRRISDVADWSLGWQSVCSNGVLISLGGVIAYVLWTAWETPRLVGRLRGYELA